MAANKRQHFVPKCYMKPFSRNTDGAAINVFNIAGRRFIPNASVKGQCAKDYLYGEDLEVERALQVFEGEYARIIKGLLERAYASPDDLAFLVDFAFLQYSRTEMAMQRTREMHEGLRDTIHEGIREKFAPEIDLSDRAMMHMSMELYVKAREDVEDLKACIAVNGTRRDFITSDDPSVLTSRFHAQRLLTQVYGFGSSGVQLFMPLTPRHMLICYDGDVYTVPEKAGAFVRVNKDADVSALNELQYINAAKNIYFSDPNEARLVETEYTHHKPKRPTIWHRFTVMVPNGVTDRGERWRRATEEERKTAEHTMVATSTIRPTPSSWASVVRFRAQPKTYSNGSAAGHVRKALWDKRVLRRAEYL